jgi:hypothetical protein
MTDQQEQMTGTVTGGRRRVLAQEGKPRNSFGPLGKVLLAILLMLDGIVVSAWALYGTADPCRMVALSQASMHTKAVDPEYAITGELVTEVNHASFVWVRTRMDVSTCAGAMVGRVTSALVP